jgi:hypothetical protein
MFPATAPLRFPTTFATAPSDRTLVQMTRRICASRPPPRPSSCHGTRRSPALDDNAGKFCRCHRARNPMRYSSVGLAVAAVITLGAGVQAAPLIAAGGLDAASKAVNLHDSCHGTRRSSALDDNAGKVCRCHRARRNPMRYTSSGRRVLDIALEHFHVRNPSC